MSSSHQLLDCMFTCWAATENPYLADIQQQFGSQTSLTRLFCWSVGRLTVGEVSAVASEGAAFTAGEETMWSPRPSLPPPSNSLANITAVLFILCFPTAAVNLINGYNGKVVIKQEKLLRSGSGFCCWGHEIKDDNA